jgi:hypothetical protein
VADNTDRSRLDQTTRILSEGLARAIDRRTFIKRASQSAFAGLLALTVGHGLPGRAAAKGGPTPPQPPIGGPVCNPPGPYCNLNGVNEPNGCHGGHCFQHRYQGQVLSCRIVYNWYQAGCWTTPVGGGGYWTCCDCGCGQNPPYQPYCGCAQYTGPGAPPPPLPDAPPGKLSN